MAPLDRRCPRCAAPLAAEDRFCGACGLSASRLLPGEVLDGKYEILEKIGEGGMGEVYRVRHLHLDEIRIIKVTKPDVTADGAPARRFQEEARLATLVRHPSVAALYDFSRQADGSYYMVWEYIDGLTLETWLRRHGKLAPAGALEVARQVLAGLSEIHAQGIVHRDISPDNIMLRELPGGRLQAKVIDLGIAKRVAAESLQMTSTGLFLGKLKYCSPEQAGALSPEEGLDARTDVYSFGVVLYEMLSGKAPFESSTPEGYIGKHLHTPAPPLDVAALPRELGPPLAAVVARTLEKKRERRYASVLELADALARIAPAAHGPAAARPASRGRTLALASLAALAVAAVAVLVARRSGGSRDRAGADERARAAAHAARPSPSAPSRPGELLSAPASPQRLPDAFGAASTLMPVPAFVQPAPTAAPGAPDVAAANPPPAAPAPSEAERLITLWKARPNEARARRAQEIARMANDVAGAYPADPRTAAIKATLPPYLRAQATAALDAAEPLVALLYFRSYRMLDFAPPDADLQRRLEMMRPSEKSATPPRPTPGAP